jgi:substrate import-associated zinc metallohydrolase lipoprotein
MACSKDDLTPDSILLGMGGDTWVKSELDEWLYQEFVIPYNMEIKYKWDPYEVNLQKMFVPVEESKVKDLMTAVKKIWVMPYENKAGSRFIKILAPKRYVLVGTPEYNGTSQTLGYAEGGNKITILDVNTFDKTSAANVRSRLKTVEHEFAHTLHQTVLYPEEFTTISYDAYTGNWNTTPDAEFPSYGFVSKYARANSDEDFAETVSYIIMNGRAAFNSYVASAGTIGGTRLRAKEAIIVNYFKQVWNIDFYETYAGAKDGLVDITQQAIADFVANP